MATFVLVPGAWLGGWCWQRVTPLLRNGGHDVFTLTLTGLAERSHLFTPDVGLETHVTDVVNVLEYEDLRDVILLGHSYAGMVAGSVAGRIPERIAQLVYLAATVPEDGKSMYHDWSADGIAEVESESRERCDGLRWPLPDELQGLGVGLSLDDEVWLRGKATPHPIKSFKDRAQLTDPERLRLPHTFIHCTGEGSKLPPQVSGDTWRIYEIPSGHWPMVTMPQELANILMTVGSEV